MADHNSSNNFESRDGVTFRTAAAWENEIRVLGLTNVESDSLAKPGGKSLDPKKEAVH
jgi:hypothetical protein